MKKLLVFAAICAASITISSTRVAAAPKTPTLQNTTKATTKTATFLVEGMHCINCSKGLTQALQSLKGVRSANVNLATKRASVVFDPQQQSVQKLRTFITQAGFKATPATRQSSQGRKA